MTTQEQFEAAHHVATSLIAGLEQVIRGRRDTVELIVAALLADGHALLEDYPGSGKTTLAKTLGRLISADYDAKSAILPFRRVQFTPDMLPGDVLGVTVFEPSTGQFRFVHGPIFAHVVLADEINRTGPKVQAAFLECLAEKQVTLDNVTHPLDELFFVLGTQNPLDVAGTYPLPHVQLDRFLFRIPMSYVDTKTEIEILTQHTEIARRTVECAPVTSRHEVLRARKVVQSLPLAASLREAIVDIAQATRVHPSVVFGASTRAALMLQRGLQAIALVRGKRAPDEDDLKQILPYVLLHRLKFQAGAGDAKKLLADIAAPGIDKLVRGGRR